MVRCAHGDVVLYPLADVRVQISGITFTVWAVVSHTLPVFVLLGKNVPELEALLGECVLEGDCSQYLVPIHPAGDASIVVTRGHARAQTEVERERAVSQNDRKRNTLHSSDG